MHRTNFALPGLPLLLCTAMLGAGCLITTGGADEADADGSATDATDPSASSFTAGSSGDSMTSIDPDTTGDDSVGTTTGVPMGECSDSIILDGGFEAGSPSEVWEEASLAFGTPICDAACTEDAGAEPYAGDWFAWFGGVDDEPEEASVAQSVVIGGQTAFLSFRFWINASAGGSDVFEVLVDDTSVFMVSDAEIADFDGYTPVSIDISDFADGASHTVTFASVHAGTGLSNFFLDEVALVTCVDGEGTTGGSGTSAGSSETTAADSGSSGGSSDGSSSGGSDSSSGSTSN